MNIKKVFHNTWTDIVEEGRKDFRSLQKWFFFRQYRCFRFQQFGFSVSFPLHLGKKLLRSFSSNREFKKAIQTDSQRAAAYNGLGGAYNIVGKIDGFESGLWIFCLQLGDGLF